MKNNILNAVAAFWKNYRDSRETIYTLRLKVREMERHLEHQTDGLLDICKRLRDERDRIRQAFNKVYENVTGKEPRCDKSSDYDEAADVVNNAVALLRLGPAIIANCNTRVALQDSEENSAELTPGKKVQKTEREE